ncbi:hypothetical protein FRB97_008108 [Tulasnella sp. 331]|nr:hypothetical protein FRB97_008108 [Tulasnella sp. 331]
MHATEVPGVIQTPVAGEPSNMSEARTQEVLRAACEAAQDSLDAYKATYDHEQLYLSISKYKAALALCPPDHQWRSLILNNLGIASHTRFKHTGITTDLEQSIRYYQEALSIRAVDHSDRPLTLNCLGTALETRFYQTGRVTDLDEGTQLFQEALSLCPIGHPTRCVSLANLGSALHKRFDQRSDKADLDKGIQYLQDAFAICPIDHPERSLTLNNLGNAIRRRFDQLADMAILDESILYHREALLLCPKGHADWPWTLNNLANALRRRSQRLGDGANLDEAVRLLQEALSVSPVGHPHHAGTLNNLGAALQRRFDQRLNMDDLRESIHCHQDALSVLPESHPNRSWALNYLGDALQRLFDNTHDSADFDMSIQYYRDASENTLSPLPHRLIASRNWVAAARKHGSDSVVEAYAFSMDLLDRSLLLVASSAPDSLAQMSLGLNRSRRYITQNATSCAIEKNQLKTAIEFSERGRALLFSQLGSYRTSLDDLDVKDSRLAGKLRTLSAALEDSAFFGGATVGQADEEDHAAKRQRIAAEWDRTLEEIRRLEGFENFLRITPFAQLQEAASEGPVIIVNISRFGSDAIIIHKSAEPVSIPLPEAPPVAIEALVHTLNQPQATRGQDHEWNRVLGGLLKDIWRIIVEPIVSYLENTLDLPRGSRIWWMPTSLALLLPLHAAGSYGPGDKNLSDRFVSSYTSTLSSLIRSRSGYQPSQNTFGPHILVVAQFESGAEGEQHLYHVNREVASIRTLQVQLTVLEGDECTKDAVLAGMKEAAWAHFACHVKQLSSEPFKSHFSFQTRDTSLTLLDILRNDLPHAELAVLSASHSAAGNDTTPDELIHLTAGMLFAGFRGVVGTMWAMLDEDGLVFTKDFYTFMFRKGPEAVDCKDAAMALTMAVKGLRQRRVPLGRWINFVHYGI